MERTQELIEQYTDDYKLDKQTKEKAVELFQEFLSKIPQSKPVSCRVLISTSHIFLSYSFILFAALFKINIYSSHFLDHWFVSSHVNEKCHFSGL